MRQFKSRKPNRLKEYDYSKAGYYFVTICTYVRIEWFGKIKDNQMDLNSHGQIVKQQWQWLEKQYPYITLDEFIVMPNHIHGIIIINDSVGNGRDRSLPTKSLSSLIGAFKTTSSKLIHENNLPEFKWQKSFHDHIIRNDRSLKNIREYIINNPATWEKDENNINNYKLTGQACLTPTE